ncbi:MAG: sugar-binding protein [Candidatus Brocadiia bacterium]
MKSKMLAAMAIALLTLTAAASPTEKTRPVPEAKLAEILKSAPALPGGIVGELGIKAHLIDFVDCTRTDDPHDFRDQGTSKVESGPAGTYRVTAPHRHAFFSYAYRTAGADKPVLLVIEYPDDAQRMISFMTHDSMRPGIQHLSFSQETGVYTGAPYPLTNKMQYFTLVSWPQDNWSPLIVFNFGRTGGAGAASRIWAYAIDELPPLEVNAPDPANERVLGAFFPLLFLAQRDNFGWQSPRSVEHMVDYFKFIGVNRVTAEVYGNQTWGAMCTVPAWDADDHGNLDDVLRRMDAKGGMSFIAGIVAPGMYGRVTAGGRDVATLPPEQFKAVMLKGFDELIERYGKYKSFKGFALGSMETIGFYDMLQAKGAAAEVVAHIKARRPNLDVMTFVGNPYLQTPYFDGQYGPTSWDVIAKWERAGGGDWPAFLAGEILADFTKWRHVPAELEKVAGLQVCEQYAPDDCVTHPLYRQEPRAMIYADTERSQARSDLFRTPYAAIFGTFTEGWIGLHKDLNFWYTKPWTAPELNPAGEFATAAWALAEGQHDRLAITAGGWSVKYFGLDLAMRRFAKAFRALPPVEMAEAPASMDFVKARWAIFKGKRYSSLQNLTPFAVDVEADSTKVRLGPCELATLVDDGTSAPKVVVARCADYENWLRSRCESFARAVKELAAINRDAVPEAYEKLAAIQWPPPAGALYAADMALSWGLSNEIQLRRDIVQRPEMKAAKLPAAPPMNGNLDAWPKEAADIRAEGGEYLAGHIFFPNSWTGPKDLSARIRLGHDGKSLYLGVEVRDNVLEKGDSFRFSISKSGYADWRTQSVKPDYNWLIEVPFDKPQTSGGGQDGFTYVCRRTPAGYVVEGSAPLESLGLKPGGAMGLLLVISDSDNTPNLAKESWSRKQEFLYPHKPNFPYWDDARNCGKLIIE